MELELFDQAVSVERRDDVADPDWAVISPRLESMATLDDALPAEIGSSMRDTFHLIETIVVFERIRFKNLLMSRSFMDIANRAFHWHVSDLGSIGYSSGARVLSYFLHDAHHVAQWLANDRAPQLAELVRREVDATDVQIRFATAAQADSTFIKFLTDYRNDPKAIERRLRTGVGILESIFSSRPRFESHLPIL
jgi:hypothetical protein